MTLQQTGTTNYNPSLDACFREAKRLDAVAVLVLSFISNLGPAEYLEIGGDNPIKGARNFTP